VLVGVTAASNGARVQAGLVRERGGAHIGLLGVGGDVHELGDVVRHRRDPFQAIGRDGSHIELERQLGWPRRGPRSPSAPIAVHTTLHVGRPGRTPAIELATAQPESLWKCTPLALEVRHDAGNDALRVMGRVPPLVSQSTMARPRPPRGAHHPQREFSGSSRNPSRSARRRRNTRRSWSRRKGEEIHRVGRHRDGLVERRAQRLGDMEPRRLGHDADGFVFAFTSWRSTSSSSARTLGPARDPKATSVAVDSPSSAGRERRNSSSLGLAPGQPPR